MGTTTICQRYLAYMLLANSYFPKHFLLHFNGSNFCFCLSLDLYLIILPLNRFIRIIKVYE